MKHFIGSTVLFFSCLLFAMDPTNAQQPDTLSGKKYVLLIHGGAGTINRKNLTPEKEAAYKDGLLKALQAGYAKIQTGATSIDAVQAAINVLEDNPLFNAGKGAVFTHDGKNEMDASIMNGKTLEAGAVAGVTVIKNPINAARAVMEKTEHVMLVGKGAEVFAREVGLEIVDPSYFWTQDRWNGLQKALKQDSAKAAQNGKLGRSGIQNRDDKFGTVGCVALDNQGNLAAGTSTGGMTDKKYGRVGDSPIIGAGTYANNQTAAVSCTGWGEFYIRTAVAHTISDLMEFKGDNVRDAARTALERMAALGGDGGIIAIDKDGHIATPFNTDGMYRGAVTADGKFEIAIFK
ncbi:MAG: isoaspartyl peptidase/L-asparaginase [Chitinophagaceae bacterium]